MFKFIHAADIHLDSPLLNLDQYDGAPVETFRDATRRALDNLVEIAIHEQVAFVIIAGDLYDGDCRDFNTPLHFRRKMRELESHSIRVFLCHGNHDAQNNMKKAFRLDPPPNLHIFSTKEPETILLEEYKVALHGQGFAERVIEEDLSVGYPEPVSGWMNVGVLHTSCGHHESHARYAPSSVRGLTSKGYDYWALGHIHKRQDLAGGPKSAHICYPGNTQGRHIRETGPKGCNLVTVADIHEPISIQFRATDVVRWQRCRVDASQCAEPTEIVEDVRLACEKLIGQADDRPLAVRIEIHGNTRAHHSLATQQDYWDREIRTHMLSLCDDQIWVEKIKFSTRPSIDVDSTPEPGDPLGDLLVGIRDLDGLSEIVSELQDELGKLAKQIPTDPRLPMEQVHFDDPASPEMLEDVKQMLIGRLLEPGVEP